MINESAIEFLQKCYGETEKYKKTLEDLETTINNNQGELMLIVDRSAILEPGTAYKPARQDLSSILVLGKIEGSLRYDNNEKTIIFPFKKYALGMQEKDEKREWRIGKKLFRITPGYLELINKKLNFEPDYSREDPVQKSETKESMNYFVGETAEDFFRLPMHQFGTIRDYQQGLISREDFKKTLELFKKQKQKDLVEALKILELPIPKDFQ